MGEVFLAREEAPRRACVVKKVLPQLMASPQFAGRFRDEARVVVRLHHPNIARVYAMGEVEGQLYLAMEYVQGKTLSRLTYRLRQLGRTLPLGIMLLLGQRLCEGLAYAHDATDESGHPLHLVHRDLSPANVCISYAGEVKIIDFGAAQSTLKEQQTAPRVVIGNLTYMAPEQARKRFVDRRADVYAVGALLWELFAWRPLVQRGDPVERWRRAAYPQWEPAGRFRQGVPSSVDAFLMRALASEPDNRFPDAVAMGDELARLKAKLAPKVTDEDLARFISAAFPREKKAEDLVLRELLREPRSRALTEPGLAKVLAPPTALAFEHDGIEAPEDFVPAERGEADAPAAADSAARGAPATALYGTEEESTVVDAGALRARLNQVQGEHLGVRDARVVDAARRGAESPPGDEDAEPTVVRSEHGGTVSSDAEPTLVQSGPGRSASQQAMGPLPRPGSELTQTPSAVQRRVTGQHLGGEAPGALTAQGVSGQPGAGDTAATEAVDAAKLMVALERADAARGNHLGTAEFDDVTVTAVGPARAPRPSVPEPAAPLRRATRETQVGFGVDISQAVDAAAVEARRLELLRTISGDDELPAAAPEKAPVAWLHGRRTWIAAGLFTGACALGLALAWALS